MSVAQVIVALNDMAAERVIERYAIGGAVGATFYMEPAATEDIDVFVTFRNVSGSLLASTKPILDYLVHRGGTLEGGHVRFAGWPIQFLPPVSPLVQEAMEQAVTKDVDGLPARVFTAEHLAAIALETGRAKDKARLAQFLEESAVRADILDGILMRHGLVDKWKKFQALLEDI